jgi:hypothetical protein
MAFHFWYLWSYFVYSVGGFGLVLTNKMSAFFPAMVLCYTIGCLYLFDAIFYSYFDLYVLFVSVGK